MLGVLFGSRKTNQKEEPVQTTRKGHHQKKTHPVFVTFEVHPLEFPFSVPFTTIQKTGYPCDSTLTPTQKRSSQTHAAGGKCKMGAPKTV